MQVLVLTHPDLVPPRGARARPANARPAPWATEHDVLEGLARLGHTARCVGVSRSLVPLARALEAERPGAVLNLLEEYRGDARGVARVVGWLERRGVAVTGCPARALARAHDKARARLGLEAHGLPLPAGRGVPRRGRAPSRAGLPWPRVVKSATLHGSEGLTRASIVTSERGEAAQLRRIHRHVGTDALVEAYVEGRELYVGVLGGRALAPCELARGRARGPWIATSRTKWDPAYRARHDLAYGPAGRLTGPARRRVLTVARRAARALGVSACARIDLRLDARGRPWVIEVNANPDLISWGEFASGAQRVGIGYDALLERLLAVALRGRRPAARARTARARRTRAR
jgi:D-alanine-D-alanine ligase